MGGDNGIEPERFARAIDRLHAGEPVDEVLDDTFVAAYAIAGTIHECLDQCQALAEDGVTELTLTFQGERPEEGMAQLGAAANAA